MIKSVYIGTKTFLLLGSTVLFWCSCNKNKDSLPCYNIDLEILLTDWEEASAPTPPPHPTPPHLIQPLCIPIALAGVTTNLGPNCIVVIATNTLQGCSQDLGRGVGKCKMIAREACKTFFGPETMPSN